MPLIPRRRRAAADAMTVVEHLDELRRRLIISLLAIVAASVVGFAFYRRILGFLVGPYRAALEQFPPEARPPGEGLVFQHPIEAFQAVLKIGFTTGFLLALPVVLYQLWRFVTPGLTPRERRLALPFVIVSVGLFAAGVAFAFGVLPRGLGFLLTFGGDDLVPLLTAQRYLNFVVFLILGFGLSFEFPVLMVFLAAAGVVTTAQMRRWRRYAYFGSAVFAALITPTQDPYTMVLMWGPLVLLYEASILTARLMKR